MRNKSALSISALCTFGWFFAFASDGFAGQATDTLFLPLRIGNQWTLMKDGMQITERIVDTVRVNDRLYFQFDTLNHQPDVMLRESGARVYRYLDTSEVLWYDFSADSGTTWTIPDLGNMTAMGTNETVHVPAGDFSGCRSYYWFLGFDAATTEWFARGIGFVKREVITIAGPSSWSLTRAIVTSVEDQGEPETVSSTFKLEQNFPNPFNPTTVVSSQLPVASNVTLVVYDVLGREVAILVNERRAAGNYQDGFNGSGLASGVYLYRLTASLPAGQAGSFVQSRTMLLIK